jgi:DNA-directed RNA polymerase specialized sigma24 family protein
MPPAQCLDDDSLRATLDARFRVPLMSFFLRRIKNRTEAEDLTQEVFVRLIGSPEPHRIKCAKAFVFRVATNMFGRDGYDGCHSGRRRIFQPAAS